jgi:hypothetical protein
MSDTSDKVESLERQVLQMQRQAAGAILRLADQRSPRFIMLYGTVADSPSFQEGVDGHDGIFADDEVFYLHDAVALGQGAQVPHGDILVRNRPGLTLPFGAGVHVMYSRNSLPGHPADPETDPETLKRPDVNWEVIDPTRREVRYAFGCGVAGVPTYQTRDFCSGGGFDIQPGTLGTGIIYGEEGGWLIGSTPLGTCLYASVKGTTSGLIRLVSNVPLFDGLIHGEHGVQIWGENVTTGGDGELPPDPGDGGSYILVNIGGITQYKLTSTVVTGGAAHLKTIVRGRTTAVVKSTDPTFHINQVIRLAGSDDPFDGMEGVPGTGVLEIQNSASQSYGANKPAIAAWNEGSSHWNDLAIRDGMLRHVVLSSTLEPARLDGPGKLTLGPESTCGVRTLGAGTLDSTYFLPIRNALLYRVEVPLGQKVEGLAAYDEFGTLCLVSTDPEGLFVIRITSTIPGATETSTFTKVAGKGTCQLLLGDPGTNPMQYTVGPTVDIENIDGEPVTVESGKKYDGFAQRNRHGRLLVQAQFCNPLRLA